MRNDDSLLEAALIGYQHQRELIEAKIAEIQRQLGSSAGSAAVSKRGFNTSARTRISAVAPRGENAKPKKRMMSAEGRERIAEATRKRWAQFRANKAAALKAGKASKKKVAASAATQSEGEA